MLTAKNHRAHEHLEKTKELEIFTGTWKVTGKNFTVAPGRQEAPLHGEDEYRWMDGHFFITDTWKHLSKGNDHTGFSVLGYDQEKKQFFIRNFDNLGFERRYVLHREGNTWKFTGSNERAVRQFNHDRNAYTEQWEMFNGESWIPLCEMMGSKISS